MHIVVAGGGITGLSSAFHLSRKFPNALITLFDKSPTLGGWVQSERVQIPGSSETVLLEAGPRTLRPNARSVLELVNLLKLRDSVIVTPKSSPAAQKRYLHLPGEAPGLIEIPNSLLGIFTSPLRSVLLSSVLKEPFRSSNRPQISPQDESVDSFLTRRFGEPFARIFGSALIHGIYAADSRQIGVRAAFPALWDAEDTGSGSVVRGFLHPSRLFKRFEASDYELGDIPQLLKDASVYSFRDGMSTLTNALLHDLRCNPRVRLSPDDPINAIRVREDTGKLEVVSTSDLLEPTHILSALPLPILHKALSPPTRSSLPHLFANPYSSVTVVNLVFRKSPQTRFPEGFGYLIPRPPDGGGPLPSSYSPVILGTVFDSCALSAQDSHYPQSNFIKMTVMVREGRTTTTNDDPPPADSSSNRSPNDDLLESIISQLSHHLAFPSPGHILKPVYTRIVKNESCIPVLMPGHVQRMTDLKNALQKSPWLGRLEVVGAGVGGVSIGDCVEAGKRAGGAWVDNS